MYIYNNLSSNARKCFTVRLLHLIFVLILLKINTKFNRLLIPAIVIGMLHVAYIIVDMFILLSIIYCNHMYKLIYILDVIFIILYSDVQGTYFRHYFMILLLCGFYDLIVETYKIIKDRKHKSEMSD